MFVKWKRPFLIFLAALMATFVLTWFHHQFVVTNLDFANKDFMSLWTGGKALLRDLDPYDVAVWEPLRAEYGSRWMPDPRAPFPLWTFLFTAPFALLSIPWSAALWLTISELLLVVVVFLTVKSNKHRPSPIEIGLLVLGTFASIVTILVLINGQMTMFLLLALASFLWLLRVERPFWAGVVLSFIIVKPNPFIAFVPLVGLWLLQRRRWSVIVGGVAGVLALLVITWAAQPGWLLEWLNVREKTAVVTITPTLWGLAADLAGAWWLPLGLLMTICAVGGTGWFIFSRPNLSNEVVISLAIAVSLLTTPYAWTYEHAILYIPWTWLLATDSNRRRAQSSWFFLTFLLPWLLFLVAAARVNDSLAFLSPALALTAVILATRRQPVERQS